MQEQLFASFILDSAKGLEIALKAENVTEATSVNGKIQEIPATVDYLEGVMPLRDKVIQIINLKKRFGFSDSNYGENAKVEVVDHFNQQFGLLFDDIKEVFRAEDSRIVPISASLQTEDKIISSLIQMKGGGQPCQPAWQDWQFCRYYKRNCLPDQFTRLQCCY